MFSTGDGKTVMGSRAGKTKMLTRPPSNQSRKNKPTTIVVMATHIKRRRWVHARDSVLLMQASRCTIELCTCYNDRATA
jgi:hypothetical protein